MKRDKYNINPNQERQYFSTQTYMPNNQAYNPSRNQKRAQQISALHQQFEDLKKKIKQVQNKNQKIIDKIHKAFSFKKKPPGAYTQQHIPQQHQPISPIIYYDQNYQKSYLQGSNVGTISHHPSSIDAKSQKSNESQYQFNMQKRGSNMSSSKRKKDGLKGIQKPAVTNFHVSMEYAKPYDTIGLKNYQYEKQRDISERGSIRTPPSSDLPLHKHPISHYEEKQPKMKQNQLKAQFYQGNSPSIRASRNYDRTVSNLQETLSIQKEKVNQLSAQIQDKDVQIYALQSSKQKFKGYANFAKINFQSAFQNFIENTIRAQMIKIQRTIKNNEKKMNLLINHIEDFKQENKMRKKIKLYKRDSQKSRQKDGRDRLLDRERRQSMNQSSDMSKSRSKAVNNQASINKKANKQFQQIAARYQVMLRQKNQQIQKIDKKLKLKQKECNEFKGKIQELQNKLRQQEKKRIDFVNFSKISITPSFSNINSGNYTQNILQLRNSQNSQFGEDQILLVSQKSEKSGSPNYQNLMNSQKDLQKSQLKQKIQQLQKNLIQKNSKIEDLQQQLKVLQNKNEMLYEQYQQNMKQNKNNKNKHHELLQKKLRDAQNQIDQKNRVNQNIRNNLTQKQKKLLQKQCQMYGLNNKLSKYQHLIEMKDKKIDQLQKMLIINNQQGGDINLDKSLVLQVNSDYTNNINTVKKLKQQLLKAQQDLQYQKNQNYTLVKQKQHQDIKLKQFQQKNYQLKRQNQSLLIQLENLQTNNFSNTIQSKNNFDNFGLNNYDEDNQQKLRLQEQLNQLSTKYQNTNKNLQLIKSQNLQINSKLMKIQSQLDYQNTLINQKDKLLEKQRNQIQKSSDKMSNLEKQLAIKTQQVQIQRKENQEKLKQIQQQWQQFQQQMKLQNQMNQDQNVGKSERSSVVNFKNNYNKLATQNQYLTEKLKEAQAQIQMQNTVQQRIIEEYKKNVDQVKIQLKQRKIQNQKLLTQNQKLKIKLSIIQRQKQKFQSKSIKSEKGSGINLKQFPGIPLSMQRQDLYSNEDDKIYQLQNEIRQTKNINTKLTQMLNELFQQIKSKQQQKNDILRSLEQRNFKIQQLQDLLELKEINFGSNISANISSTNKSRQRDSMKSQSSLRYSAASHAKNTANNNNSNDKTIQIDLSEAGSSFFQNSQMVDNVSQFFQKDEFPYQKMKLKRKEQIRLFEKTASYIKTLKTAIQQKNKRIRILEKKIQSLKTNELVRKDLAGYDIMHQQKEIDFDDKNFRDYDSVQLQYKRSTQHRRYKMLEHDTKLVIQENNMLVHQIQSLQQQLLKSQEQENSLVKIKDLYKQQIKKLIKKNEEQAKSFQEEINKQRKKIEQSENIHNFEAVKQLFVKMALVFGVIQQQKGRKKQQKKKQLQQYIKVMCSILRVQVATKDKLLAGIRA